MSDLDASPPLCVCSCVRARWRSMWTSSTVFKSDWGRSGNTGASILLTVSICAWLNSLFVIPLTPLITEKGRQSIILHYFSLLPCIDTSGLVKVGAGVLFAVCLIMECRWNICIFHSALAKQTVSHCRYELMIKWHREMWWRAKKQLGGGWTTVWRSAWVGSCLSFWLKMHLDKILMLLCLQRYTHWCTEEGLSGNIPQPFVHISVSVCPFVPTRQLCFASCHLPGAPSPVFTIFCMSTLTLLPCLLFLISPSSLVSSLRVLSLRLARHSTAQRW